MPARRLRSVLRLLLKPTPSGAELKVPPEVEPAPEAILFRLLGADQPPLVPAGTIRTQVRFLLEHEPDLPGLEKRWLLHRIVDADEREALIRLLDEHGQRWHELPFEPAVYSACWMDLGAVPSDRHPWTERFAQLSPDQQAQVLDYIARAKSLYLFNRNEARNLALQLGWVESRWVFPWDSSCLLTLEAWQVIRPLLALPDLAYLSVPCASFADVPASLHGLDQPPLAEAPPLLGFARNARPPFDPGRRVGSGSDRDLLRRLGLAGPGRQPPIESAPWEVIDTTPLSDRALLVQAGWAYRLPPQHSWDSRVRRENLRLSARRTDMQLLGAAMARQPLRCWTGLVEAGASIPGLAAIAANARSVPPPSVTDKPETLPGLSERSYVNAVPHWQSLAATETALDRSRLLGSCSPVCGDVALNYDRARLQLMIDCVCALALDGSYNTNDDSLTHAHRLVRAWFLDPGTAMIPDGAYARISAVDAQRNVLDAAIDFRDFYPLLDALTLLRERGCFSLAEQQQLEEWFDAFLTWLAGDSAAFLCEHSSSPASTWYHLLMLAIAAFRGRRNVAAQVFDNLPGLLALQFRPDGSPRAAAADATLRHENLFNLQAWANLVVISSSLGRDLFAFIDSNGIGLRAVLSHAGRHLPQEADSTVQLSARTWLTAVQAQIQPDLFPACLPDLPPLPEASSGLPPFWSLCRVSPLN